MRTEVRALTQTPAWRALADHYTQLRPIHLRQSFAAAPHRAERFAVERAGLILGGAWTGHTGKRVRNVTSGVVG
jgi:glucose-6-phosphate isomerase